MTKKKKTLLLEHFGKKTMLLLCVNRHTYLVLCEYPICRFMHTAQSHNISRMHVVIVCIIQGAVRIRHAVMSFWDLTLLTVTGFDSKMMKEQKVEIIMKSNKKKNMLLKKMDVESSACGMNVEIFLGLGQVVGIYLCTYICNYVPTEIN